MSFLLNLVGITVLLCTSTSSEDAVASSLNDASSLIDRSKTKEEERGEQVPADYWLSLTTLYTSLRAEVNAMTTEVNAARTASIAATTAWDTYHASTFTFDGSAPAPAPPDALVTPGAMRLSEYSRGQVLFQVAKQAQVTLKAKRAMLQAAYWKLWQSDMKVSNQTYANRFDVANKVLASGTEHYPTQLSLGKEFTCAIFSSAFSPVIRCWGKDSSGQVGNGAAGDVNNLASSTIVNVGTGRTPKFVQAIKESACAILDGNQIKCWGENAAGQLGTGDNTDLNAPHATNVVNLGAGRTAKGVYGNPMSQHFCAILDNDDTKCWGKGDDGRLGNGATGSTTAPNTVVNFGAGRFAKSLAIGEKFGCAILNNNGVKCWGKNDQGQLGQNNMVSVSSPAALADVDLGIGRSARFVSAGQTQVCAILDNNDLKCWGDNIAYSLGNLALTQVDVDQTSPPATPVNLGAGRYAVFVASASHGHCAILDNNKVKCWGKNEVGQSGLGNNDAFVPSNLALPAQEITFAAGRIPITLQVGRMHTCAVMDNNKVSCWGWNNNGQLGDGSATDRWAPIAPAALPVR